MPRVLLLPSSGCISGGGRLVREDLRRPSMTKDVGPSTAAFFHGGDDTRVTDEGRELERPPVIRRRFLGFSVAGVGGCGVAVAVAGVGASSGRPSAGCSTSRESPLSPMGGALVVSLTFVTASSAPRFAGGGVWLPLIRAGSSTCLSARASASTMAGRATGGGNQAPPSDASADKYPSQTRYVSIEADEMSTVMSSKLR